MLIFVFSKLYTCTDKVHNLLKKDLRKLILFAVKENHFIFHNNVYNQSVAMGSPLGPLLASIFMFHFETNALDNYLEIIPIMYRHYIDDCFFFIFTSQKSSDVFFEYLNKLHPNIKLTKQDKHDNILPFLDVLITRDNDGLLNTSIYKKPTFSGLYTKWTSYVPKQVKVNPLITLLNRALHIFVLAKVYSTRNSITLRIVYQ